MSAPTGLSACVDELAASLTDRPDTTDDARESLRALLQGRAR